MVKAKSENNTNNSGTMLTAADGTQYFVMGKIRIKVSEHFAENGKPLNSLLEDVIPVSYTHLDVYKRQIYNLIIYNIIQAF